MITERGKPSAYLVDVETYEAQTRRMRVLEGIARGERALQEGRTTSDTEARARLSRWLK